MKDGVFAILKISYNPFTRRAEGGICGTGFFYSPFNFITAYHCFNSNTFIPNKGYKEVRIFLANESGKIIYNPKIYKQYPEFDLSIGRINSRNKNVKFLSLSDLPRTNFKKIKSVYNLGFPARHHPLSKAEIQNHEEELIVNKVPLSLHTQRGHIKERVENFSINANDIKVKNKVAFILNYTSELGFSGGPLFDKSTSKVIAFMSLVIPENRDLDKPAVAISVENIKHLL